MRSLATLDFVIIVSFFVLIVYFGYLFKQVTGTTRKFFLADRSLPGWLAGITFISGNVSAMEILGLAGGAYVYGLVFAQYDWIGAIPAIVFLSLILVRYYYGNRIYNLLEYTGKRYGENTRIFHSFLVLTYMLLALGVGLYAFALALQVMLGLPILFSIFVSAIVLAVVTAAGGLSATVLVQFLAFILIWFSLLPLPFFALQEVGWWAGLTGALDPEMLTVWRSADDSFMSWPATFFGLGFALSFASWSTDQAIMQNVLAAKSLRDARMAPLVGGIFKLAVPLITVIPGLAAAVLLPDLEKPDTVMFQLILRYYPSGLAGLAFLSVMAGFAAMNTGMIMGISNIFTRNIYALRIKKQASESHYLIVSRLATSGALLIAILSALAASRFKVFYIWIQEFNIFIIIPLLAVILLGLFWKRTTTKGAVAGLVAGSVGGITGFLLNQQGQYLLWRAFVTFLISASVTVVISLVTKARSREELSGVVWGTLKEEVPAEKVVWWKRPATLAAGLLGIMVFLVIIFA